MARSMRRVINSVQRGYHAVIESHGEPEVALMDITDYYIVRAVMRYHNRQPALGSPAGLEALSSARDAQARFDLVLAYYLAGEISLSRASELLRLPWLELRTRFLRLDVPLRTAPVNPDDALEDVRVAADWAGTQ